MSATGGQARAPPLLVSKSLRTACLNGSPIRYAAEASACDVTGPVINSSKISKMPCPNPKPSVITAAFSNSTTPNTPTLPVACSRVYTSGNRIYPNTPITEKKVPATTAINAIICQNVVIISLSVTNLPEVAYVKTSAPQPRSGPEQSCR